MTETQKAQLKAKINDVRVQASELGTESQAEAVDAKLDEVDALIDTWRVASDP